MFIHYSFNYPKSVCWHSTNKIYWSQPLWMNKPNKNKQKIKNRI